MERQPHEESKVLWKLELDSAEKLTLTPEHKKLVDIVTKKIEDYSLTYYEYVEDIAAYLQQLPHDIDPKEAIETMCNHLIEKYGSEEVRSEQDQNGLSAVECDGIVGTGSDNGGTEILGEQLAKPSEFLEEV